MRKKYIFCILPWVALACQAPVEPGDKLSSLQKAEETKTIEVQLWAGRIKYAAYIGGLEWRATFETKVIIDSSLENIRDKCQIEFFWKSKSTKPTADEAGWISFPGVYQHGLMVIDGHWLDRLPRMPPPESYWMRTRVTSGLFGIVNVTGMCNFLESVERPDTLWISSDDMGYGLGKRILARAKVSNSP